MPAWLLFRPRTCGTFMIDGELIHAVLDGCVNQTTLWLQESPSSPRVEVDLQACVSYEAWLESELFLVAAVKTLPTDADLIECVASDQVQQAHDPAAGSAV
eukprot:SAG31_NODE_17988_length_650_cov_1.871143_1_plen_100_part_10